MSCARDSPEDLGRPTSQVLSLAFWAVLAAAALALRLMLSCGCQLSNALSPAQPPLGLHSYSLGRVRS